jgi:hypothetical protein
MLPRLWSDAEYVQNENCVPIFLQHLIDVRGWVFSLCIPRHILSQDPNATISQLTQCRNPIEHRWMFHLAEFITP